MFFTTKFHFSFFASFCFKFFASLHFSNFRFEAKQSKAKFKSIFLLFFTFFHYFSHFFNFFFFFCFFSLFRFFHFFHLIFILLQFFTYFWPRSFRFGSCYSQKCSLFSQKRIKCSRVPSPLPSIQQFSTVWFPLGFKNARTTAGLWLWKWGELISRISAPIFFPVFSYSFLDRFFTYKTCRFQRRTFIDS
jgi:hypothetical protein